jgi:ankyrin repeat protein
MKYIKLFEEHNYTVYDLISMDESQLIELLINEIDSKNPNLDLIRDILGYSVLDINSTVYEDWTALIYAVANGNIQATEILLEQPTINVNLQDEYGLTALIWAVRTGREDCLESLLKHPSIDVNLQDFDSRTALMYAVNRGYEKAIRLLLGHPGINVNVQNKLDVPAWELATNSIREQFPQLNPNFR